MGNSITYLYKVLYSDKPAVTDLDQLTWQRDTIRKILNASPNAYINYDHYFEIHKEELYKGWRDKMIAEGYLDKDGRIL